MRITDAGREALAFWVADATRSPCELRDEMLLKLFFSDAVGREDRRTLAEAMETRHRAEAAELGAVAEKVRQRHVREESSDLPMHKEVLRYGVEFHTWLADWYAGLRSRLNEEEAR